MEPDEREQTTVAFELEALEQVADPPAAFVQTAGWARSVGLVSDRETPIQTKRAREWGVDYSFTSGPRSVLDSLVAIRQQPEHDADRYLLIGRDTIDVEAVSRRGWAFLPVDEAAEAGGWQLRSDDDGDGESRGWP